MEGFSGVRREHGGAGRRHADACGPDRAAALGWWRPRRDADIGRRPQLRGLVAGCASDRLAARVQRWAAYWRAAALTGLPALSCRPATPAAAAAEPTVAQSAGTETLRPPSASDPRPDVEATRSPAFARLRDDELTEDQRDAVFVRGRCDPTLASAQADELPAEICVPGGHLLQHSMSWVVGFQVRAVHGGQVVALHVAVSDVDPPRFLSRGQWSEFYYLPDTAAVGDLLVPIAVASRGPGHAFACGDRVCVVGSDRNAGAFRCEGAACSEEPWPEGVEKLVAPARQAACEGSEDDGDYGYLEERAGPRHELAPGVAVQIVTQVCEASPYHLEASFARVWASSEKPTQVFWVSTTRACRPRWGVETFTCGGARFQWTAEGFAIASRTKALNHPSS